MKLQELEESKDQLELIVDWIAKRLIMDAKRETEAANQMKGIAPDGEMIHSEAKKKLQALMDKVDTELYHLAF